VAGRGNRLPEAGPIVGGLQDQEPIALSEAGRGCPVAVGQDPLDHLGVERVLAERPHHPSLLHYLLEIHEPRSESSAVG